MVKKGRDLSSILGSLEEPEAKKSSTDVNAPNLYEPPKLVPLAILVTPEDRKRMRQLGLDSGQSLQKMGHEAWSQWLESRGLPPLEPVTANVPSGRRR